MTFTEPQRTRFTRPHLAPGAWWTVEDVAISPGLGIYYKLGQSMARPAEIRDERGRSALEAFAALPIEAMAGRLYAYRRSLRGIADSRFEGRPALATIAELTPFVRTFGPIGIGWGGRFAVRNPEADRLKRELDVARYGIDPSAVPRTEPTSLWMVNFWGHGPGRGALPSIDRHLWHPERSWAERVRLGDVDLPHDFWLTLVDEHRDLVATLDLVEAVAQHRGLACRAALQYFSNEDAESWVGPPGPTQQDYGPALRGIRPAGGRLKVFRLPSHQVDWVKLGRRHLADLIDRQIDFALPVVHVTEAEAFEVRWLATSVLEVIYIELLEHLRHRESFGVGRCEGCGGPILRTRRMGGTGNRWHRGCHAARLGRWRHQGAEASEAVRLAGNRGAMKLARKA